MYTSAKGFTLIELLVVIAIIGLLSSVVLASLNAARAKARDSKRLSDIRAVVQALELYATNNYNSYPLSPTTNSTCGNTPSCVGGLTQLVSGGYLSSLPTDPVYDGTTNNYRYCATSKNDYAIIIRTESLNPSTFCRPRTTAVSTACNWHTYPAC